MKKIFIVEDDSWLAEQLKRTLDASGYETFIASHALTAVQSLDKFYPDLFIMDVLLSGVTAFTLMNELQTYYDTSKIPVILCTNLAGDLNFDSFSSYNIQKVIDKTTMKPQDLILAVKELIG